MRKIQFQVVLDQSKSEFIDPSCAPKQIAWQAMMFPEIDYCLYFVTESLDFDFVSIKDHRLAGPVGFNAERRSSFDLQAEFFCVLPAEITEVRSQIELCAAGGGLCPGNQRDRDEDTSTVLLIDELLIEFE